MIQATDLRIGNWIKRKSGNYAQVECIYPDSVHVQCEPPLKSKKGMSIPLETVSGIDLTPEILKKLGFRIDCVNTREHKQFGITVIDTSFLLEDEDLHFFEIEEVKCENQVVYNHREKRNIKYLHQVQNLYFIINDIELPITL